MWGNLLSIGAIYLKTIADTIILRAASDNPDAKLAYGFAIMKYDSYDDDMFSMLGDIVLGYFFLLSVLLPLITLIGKFMTDKISRMRESMKILGISDTTYFISYFTFYAIYQFVVSFGCALVIKQSLFKNSNYFLLALFFFLFGISIYPFAIIVW